jgi:hypothetical protein
MGAGRPREADPGTLYVLAHQLYWDFRRLAEGRPRKFLGVKKRQELESRVARAKLRIRGSRKRSLEQQVLEQIRLGRLDASEKENKLRDAEQAELFARRVMFGEMLCERYTKRLRFAAEPEVIDVLLNPKTSADEVRELCKDAFMMRTIEVEPGVQREIEVAAWPLPPGSVLPRYLTEHAEQYIDALNDPRFPGCDIRERPTNRLKQFWFLSRALAGAVIGVKTRTAINLVGSLRPEQVFQESRYAKPARKRKRKKYKMMR